MEILGIFYTFDKSVFSIGKIEENRIKISGDIFFKLSISEICQKIKISKIAANKIFVNKHIILSKIFNNRLNEIEFQDEDLISQISDFYQSLKNDKKIEIENIDPNKSHEFKSILAVLTGINPLKIYPELSTSNIKFSNIKIAF